MKQIIYATKQKMLNFYYLIIIEKMSVKELIEAKIIDTLILDNTKYTNHDIFIKLNNVIPHCSLTNFKPD